MSRSYPQGGLDRDCGCARIGTRLTKIKMRTKISAKTKITFIAYKEQVFASSPMSPAPFRL